MTRQILLDRLGSLLSFAHTSDGTLQGVHILDRLIQEAEAISVMARGSLDVARLRVLPLVVASATDRCTGVIGDRAIVFEEFPPQSTSPEPLPRLCFKTLESSKTLVLFTNWMS